METTIDSAGRLVVPKALRDRLGLLPGSKVDVSQYGVGLQILPVSRTARLRKSGGRVVAESDTVVTDDDVFDLIDAGRR